MLEIAVESRRDTSLPAPKTAGLTSIEFRFVFVGALCLALLTTIPYALGAVMHNAHSRFEGFLSFAPDFNAYFGFMRQAREGHWLFDNPFTPEPHGRVFFNLEWLVMGWLASLFGGSMEWSLQITRIVSVFLLGGAFYWLASFLFASVWMRRVAFLMGMTGGGFGWLLEIPFLNAPGRWGMFMDLYAGLHPFFWMLVQPHWLLVQALSILALCLFLHAEQAGARRLYWLTGLSIAAVGAMRPWDMVYLCGAIVFYLLGTTPPRGESIRRAVFKLVPVLAPVAPLLAYYLWLFRIHPLFRWYYLQNVGRGPAPQSLFLSLGLVGILFAFNLGKLGNFKGRSPASVLVACAALSSLVLMYSHPLFGNTWQFHQTFLIPALLVGLIGREPDSAVLSKRRTWATAAAAVLLIVNALTSGVLMVSFTREVLDAKHRTSHEILAGFDWLQRNSRPREVVLASFDLSNRIPRHTHNVVFSGYAISTVRFDEKTAMVRQFYDSRTDDVFRRKLIADYGVRYVMFGPEEKGKDTFTPGASGFLEMVFSNDLVAIYAAR